MTNILLIHVIDFVKHHNNVDTWQLSRIKYCWKLKIENDALCERHSGFSHYSLEPIDCTTMDIESRHSLVI